MSNDSGDGKLICRQKRKVGRLGAGAKHPSGWGGAPLVAPPSPNVAIRAASRHWKLISGRNPQGGTTPRMQLIQRRRTRLNYRGINDQLIEFLLLRCSCAQALATANTSARKTQRVNHTHLRQRIFAQICRIFEFFCGER